MEWNNDRTIEFIDSYRNFTCLWRCEDPNYKNRIIRNDAVQELCTKYSITPKQVLNKIKSLRSYFHKEHTKVTKKKSGSATSETYKSSWFAYTSMLFILDGDTQRSGTETEVSGYDIQENTSENERNSEIEVVEDETTSSSTNQQTLDFPTPSPKTKRKKKLSQVDEAYNFLTEAKGKLSAQDRFSSFGEVIACKLRSLNDPRLQAVAEFQINKILFQVEMQSLNMQPSCPTIVRSSDTLESDNSRPGSSTTNYSYDLSNPITPEMLSPNSETLLSAITTDTNQNSALIELQNVQQLDLDLTKFLKFH